VVGDDQFELEGVVALSPSRIETNRQHAKTATVKCKVMLVSWLLDDMYVHS
jgi:hypothetical protein